MTRPLLCLCALFLLTTTQAWGQAYYVYVTAESDDQVALIRFDAATNTATVEKAIPVGVWPTEIEGPHGIALDPEGEHWYVSLAHGNPYGKIVKYTTGTDELVDEVEVGLFPATMHLSPLTGLLYVVNFNLHGDHVPSTVSVVDPETMTEVERVPVGVMPHGSRVSPDGSKQYSVSMMTDELYEVDAVTLEVTRTLATGADPAMHAEHGGHGGMHGHNVSTPAAKPTWATPHPTKPLLYVANNGADEIAEVDTEAWTITRRFKTGKGPYNAEVSPNGKWLVVTYKAAGSTGIWNLETGGEAAVIANTRRVSHGVAISPDSRYAFVSVEGIGGEPGAVDIFDLQSLNKIATVNVGKQAGGIAFWKMEE